MAVTGAMARTARMVSPALRGLQALKALQVLRDRRDRRLQDRLICPMWILTTVPVLTLWLIRGSRNRKWMCFSDI